MGLVQDVVWNTAYKRAVEVARSEISEHYRIYLTVPTVQ